MSVTLEGVYRLVDRASPALRSIERRANAADRALDKLGRTMDKLEAKSALGKVTGLSKEMGNLEKASQRVERATSSQNRSQGTLNRTLKDGSKATKQGTSDWGRFEKAMRKVVVVTTGLGKLLAPAKFALIATAIKPLIGVLSALGAGAVALVQQVGSATGAIVPLVARLGDLAGAGAAAANILLTIKAGALVAKLALGGVTQALQGSTSAFRNLTPEAQKFVKEMQKLKPILNTLKTTAQKGLFPGLTSGLRTARRNGANRAANAGIANISGALGNQAANAASGLTDPATLTKLVGLSGTAAVVINRLGDAAINLAHAFIGVLSAARPLTEWIVRSIDTWSKYIAQQETISEGSGSLQRYFQRTRTAIANVSSAARDFGAGFINIMRAARGQSEPFGKGLAGIAKTFRSWTDSFHNQALMALWFDRGTASAKRLWSILRSTLEIFMGLGRASQNLGKTMTGGIAETMARWAEWVNSFQGQNALNRWFNNARQTLKDLWKLVADLSGAFIRLGSNGSGAQSLIMDLDRLIPDLEKILNTFATQLGPGLFGTVVQLAHLLATLTGASGSPLGMALDAVSNILGVVNHILDSFSGVRTAVGLAFTVITGALLVNRLIKIATGVNVIARAWGNVTTNTNSATLAAGRNAAVVAGESGIGAIPGAIGRGSRGSAPGLGGGAVIVGGAAAAEGAAGRFGRIGSFLKGGTGLALAAPIVAGLGTSLAQSQGLIGGRTASNVNNVLSLAGTGAIVGSVVPGVGTLAGGAIGAGAGLALNAFGGGGGSSLNPTQKYMASIANTAGRKGFDVTQAGGGATTLAAANRYQGILDQSRTVLLQRRVALQRQINEEGTDPGSLKQLDQQIAANQKLRGENIAILGTERRRQKAVEATTKALQAQARVRQSRSAASAIAGDAGKAFDTLRKGGVSVPAAFAQISRQTENKINNLKTPQGKTSLANDLHAWQAQVVAFYGKSQPGLASVLDTTNAETKKKLDKVGVVWVTSAKTSSAATVGIYAKLKVGMASQNEQALEQVSKNFTAFQQRLIAQLVGLGMSKAQAARVVSGADAKGVGSLPANSQFMPATPSFASLTKNPFGKGFAGGGRIPGSGLMDTVPVGGMAAPGELIVNRHTEARVNARLGGRGTLGGMVAGETKRHSDIMPGFATGGRVSKAVAEANRINALRSTYQFGGGHVTPAPNHPRWDCSSSTSRVLQAAGYNIPTMTAQQFMSWGEPGPGAIGVEASPGHVYMMLNGKPWGTSYSNFGDKHGPGWIHNGSGYRPGFVKRHAPNPGSMGAATGKGGGKTRRTGSQANSVALAFQGLLNSTTASGPAAALTMAGNGGSGGTSSQNQTLARAMMLQAGQGAGQWPFLQKLWTRESGFSTTAKNPSSGAFGIPQSLPASKMASAGADYLTNPRTQIKWGLGYISGRYGTPQSAWAHEMASNWYSQGGRVPEWGGWHKDGLDRTFNRPTMIGVGEGSSPERVRVGSASSTAGGGGRSIVIEVGGITIHASGEGDIRRELDQAFEDIGRMLEKQFVIEGESA